MIVFSGEWESQMSWWNGFAFSPASPAKDTFSDCRWPAILVTRGDGAIPWVPVQCSAEHHPGESSSAPLLPGAIQHRAERLPVPLSPTAAHLACQLLLGQRCTGHPIAQGAPGKEGAKRRGILGRGLALPQQHSGSLHIQEQGQSSTVFFSQAEPQPIFHLWPSHTSLLCISSEPWLKWTRPSWAQTESHWFWQSCWPEAACWLLPGATFPAFMTLLTSLDPGVAHRAAVKQRLLPGPPRGSKQHINPLWDLARTGDSQWVLWTLLPKYHTFRRLQSWCTVSSWRAAGTVTVALENELIVSSSLDVTIILMWMDFFLSQPPVWMGSTETSQYLWDFN